VLGEHKRAGVQYENSMTTCFVGEEKVLGENGTKAAAADYNYVKRPRIVLRTVIRSTSIRVRAGESFVHPITDVSAENVAGEIRVLRLFSGHVCSF
jgi:hypothetical protein